MAGTSTLTTTVAGVSYRQPVVAGCQEGSPARLFRDRDNKHDKNAICVFVDPRGLVGFIPRNLASELAPFIDDGGKWEAYVLKLTGGTPDKPTIGIVLKVTLFLEGRDNPIKKFDDFDDFDDFESLENDIHVIRQGVSELCERMDRLEGLLKRIESKSLN